MAKKHTRKTKFSSEEISVFCEQIAMLLNSGIPLYEGIHMLFSEMEDTRTKKVLEQLDNSMKANETLYDSLQKTDAFPDYMVYMVQVGETTGKLEEVMRSLSSYYERESNVKVSIKSAIAYPAVLFTMMAVIILVLVFKILPMFETMFIELNADVATTTHNMMKVGIIAGKVLAGITCLILVIMLAVFLWYRTRQGEIMIRRFVTNFRLTKKLSEAIATSKFISSMALMISSGIETSKSIDIAYGASSNRRIKEKIKQCKLLLDKDISLEQAIHDTKLLVGMESRLVMVASKSGASDTAFEKLSEQYNMKITTMLSKLSTSIETILVVTLAVLVGGVLISVMLPLVSMISSIG
ncbi:MAG: type II secretion system F family protein [Clostridiales bacterium]|nr:type II secretion system F family protein [Clostridiales bacterium]